MTNARIGLRRAVSVAAIAAAACAAGLVPGAAGGGVVETSARSAKATGVERDLAGIAARLRELGQSAERFKRFMACIREVPVSEYGDLDHRRGFHYDERDGSGLDRRPALARDRTPRRSTYTFLDFANRRRCQSSPTVIGTAEEPGTADPAKLRPSAGVARLAKRLVRLEAKEERIERSSERFDEWESCLVWVPVTEHGDPRRAYGYLFGRRGEEPGYRAAISVDRSPVDDPDHEVLSFDRARGPGDDCGGEPGEAVDRPLARETADDLEDVAQDAASLREDVEDLGEAVFEFDAFDQCAYLLGVTEYGEASGESGYVYGRGGLRPAFALDSGERRDPEYQFLTFPGEEPPSIECNEDASGESTDERPVVG